MAADDEVQQPRHDRPHVVFREEEIQQQRAIERRMEQRRAEQRRLEQRLADQEERARQSREHIRQARDVMRREMQLQVQRGLHHRMKKKIKIFQIL